MVVLARSAINRYGVSVQTRLSEELIQIQGDRVQLQQVLLNLNAVEAMDSVEVGVRELLISTEQDQTGVVVAVRDSGPGIDPAHLDRVFDAFYTTKSSGTGMGLSMPLLSSMLMGASCGRKRMSLVAPYFSSPYPAPTANLRVRFKWVTGPQSCANALGEMLFVKWLAQVAHDPVVQSASPVNIIGESGHENCRNLVARVDEASIELEPRHDRHVDVGDQTGCFGEARGREKFGCRRKNLDRIAQRSHERTHRLTKGPIIVNDRNQYLFHHAAYGHSLDPSCGQPNIQHALHRVA